MAIAPVAMPRQPSSSAPRQLYFHPHSTSPPFYPSSVPAYSTQPFAASQHQPMGSPLSAQHQSLPTAETSYFDAPDNGMPMHSGARYEGFQPGADGGVGRVRVSIPPPGRATSMGPSFAFSNPPMHHAHLAMGGGDGRVPAPLNIDSGRHIPGPVTMEAPASAPAHQSIHHHQHHDMSDMDRATSPGQYAEHGGRLEGLTSQSEPPTSATSTLSTLDAQQRAAIANQDNQGSVRPNLRPSV
jgi:hypothetical protein